MRKAYGIIQRSRTFRGSSFKAMLHFLIPFFHVLLKLNSHFHMCSVNEITVLIFSLVFISMILCGPRTHWFGAQLGLLWSVEFENRTSSAFSSWDLEPLPVLPYEQAWASPLGDRKQAAKIPMLLHLTHCNAATRPVSEVLRHQPAPDDLPNDCRHVSKPRWNLESGLNQKKTHPVVPSTNKMVKPLGLGLLCYQGSRILYVAWST